MTSTKKISNWGNYPTVNAELNDFKEANQVLSSLHTRAPIIARGTGLSYGDASLAQKILSTLKFNRVLNFNEKEGILEVEAGITIDEVLQTTVPKGWFVPVTPGTKFVTIGGAVAGDVHGKNHHTESSFCRYVTNLQVMIADGTTISCGPRNNEVLFRNICGGLGLSAVILTVQFQLKKIETSYIRQRNVIVRNLDEMLDGLHQFSASTYSVSWIDCLAKGNSLGRGVIMLGEHLKRDEVSKENVLKVHAQPKIKVPFFFPSILLNQYTIGIFNAMFYHKYRLASKDVTVHYDTFFYPLDFIRHWNKLYGRRGFLQYQFVIPKDNAKQGLQKILKEISNSGLASFLAVLKEMGPGENTLSFPIPGFTLALDFPVNNGIFPFLERLDKVVIELGGRIYLVKDARMAAETYWKGYPNAALFKEQVNQFDPTHKFASSLSDRLQMK